MRRFVPILAVSFLSTNPVHSEPEASRLAGFLTKYPEADLDADGVLTLEEASTFRQGMGGGDKGKRDAKGDPKPPGKRYSVEELSNRFEARGFDGMPYRVFVPSVEEGKRYPLVLSLHGAGGKGSDNRKNLKPWLGPLTEEGFQQRHACFIVAPQSPTAWRIPGSEPEITQEKIASFPETWQKVLESRAGWVAPAEDGKLGVVFSLLDQLAADHPVDVDRVYVLGHSMGGFGTFEAIAVEPERFAAAIPSAGGLSPWHDPAVFRNVPIWAFHGSEDRTVIPELTQLVFDRVKEVGGNMKFTTLGGVGHGAAGWAFVYDGDSMNSAFSTEMSSDSCDPTDEVWEWMFTKRRNS